MQAAKAFLIAGALALGCAGSGADSIDLTKPVTGEAAVNAEKSYKKGVEEMKSSNFLEATRYFEWVKNNFPYSQYSALSELALADMRYDRDDLEGAAKAYEEFVKSHPSHPRSDYAAFRAGLARYKDKASDTFILPPSYEREQTPLKNALDSLNKFLAAYPTSSFAPEARALVIDCRRRLLQHDRYVAEFYWKRKAWNGTGARWMGIGQTYGDLDDGKVRGEAYWRAGEAYRNGGDALAETTALKRLLAQATPADSHRAPAEHRLAEMEKARVPAAALTPPEAKPASAVAPEAPPARKPPEVKPAESGPPEATPGAEKK